jgi:CHAT domain-containing protein/tetratricopeptide (TPR) repeat protein
MRVRALVAVGVMACLSGALVWLAPPSVNRSAPILRGDTHVIRLSLPAPQLVVVTADQFEIDLGLSVTYPDGRTVEGADRGVYGRETLLFLTSTPGDYSVRIHAATNSTLRGRYDFQLQEVRPPRPADAQALQAQQKFFQAAQLERTATAESQEQARVLYRSAASLFQTAGIPMLEAQALNNAGRILDRGGKRESAYYLYIESLHIRERIADPQGRLESLHQISRLNGTLKERFAFVPDDFGFLAAWQRLGDRRAIAFFTSVVSSFFRKRSDFPQAISWADRSIELARQLGDQALEARCLRSLVDSELELRQFELALGNARRILAINRGLLDPRGESAALGLISNVLTSSGRFAEAIPFVEQDLALRSKQGDPTAVAASHYNLATLHFQLRNLPVAAWHNEQALAMTLETANDFLSPKWRNGFLSSKAIVEHYSRVLNAAGRDSEAMAAADRYRWHAFGGSGNFPVSDLLAQLDQDTVLLESWTDSDRTTLWIASPSGVRVHFGPAAGQISALASQVWTCYATKKDCRDQARQFSRALLGPVWPQLRAKRIVIAGDGILSYFPFAALPDPSRDDDRPLLLDHEIVQVPCGSALVALRRRPHPPVDPPTQIAILSDPVFDPRDPRLANPNAAPVRLDPELVRALEANGLPLEKGAIPRLSFAAAETSGLLASLPPNLPRQVHTGLDARRDFLTRPLPQGSILHIATHGFVNEDDSDLSGLVFSLVNNEGQPVDGYFRLRDLYALHLPARLVVLSACQTACGRQYLGQPAFSLSAAFLRAGAESVVASGWKVNDESTAEFMRLFYRRLLSSPDMKVPQALRAAQIEFRNNPRWSHPYFWAAFSAYGEWR